MKLSTDITPRRDGTVNAVTNSGNNYDFTPDKDGRLVADVTDQDDLEFLLDAGFFPADEADIGSGITLMAASDVTPAADEDDGGTPNAAPIESNTPPKPKGKGKK